MALVVHIQHGSQPARGIAHCRLELSSERGLTALGAGDIVGQACTIGGTEWRVARVELDREAVHVLAQRAAPAGFAPRPRIQRPRKNYVTLSAKSL